MAERELVLIYEDGRDRIDTFVEATRALADELGLSESDIVETLGKAVPAHVSQFQQRTRGGQFRRVRRYTQGESGVQKLHPSETAPRDLRGRFMRRLDDAEQAEAVAQAGQWVGELSTRLQRHLHDYELGRLTAKEWGIRCEEDIGHYYNLCYRDGQRAAGNPAVRITAVDRAIINRLVRDEMDYLRAFGDDMDAGRGRMPYHQRMELYAQAARESFWNGFVTGDRRTTRSIRWVLGPTEHCHDCLRLSDMQWQPVADFYYKVLAKGFAPQSGQLECQGHHCKCVLEERIGNQMRRLTIGW